MTNLPSDGELMERAGRGDMIALADLQQRWRSNRDLERAWRAQQFGDADATPLRRRDAYNTELVRRLQAGEPLSTSDRRDARRLLRKG